MNFADITTLTVDIAFATNPLDTPTWTTIPASKVRAVQITRGRSSEFETMNAGTCTITLDNSARDFDPLHTGSPYYPNVRPMRRVRVRMTYNAVVYDLFHGFADGWPQSYNPPNDAEVQLRCTDGFKILARAALAEVYEMEVRADNPAHWWRLDETTGTIAVDSVGTVDGSYEGDVTANSVESLVDNIGGSALDFDGVDDRATLPTVPLSYPFTIEFWYRLSTEISAFGSDTVMRHGTSEHGTYWAVTQNGSSISPGSMYLTQGEAGGSGFKRWYTNRAVNDGTRHHIVFVVWGTNDVKVYVDGTEDTNSSLTGVPSAISSGASLLLAPTPTDFLQTLDEVALYLSALSAGRITAHYNAGTEPWGTHDSDQRVTAVLDAVGWPVADRSIGDGRSTLQNASLDSRALEHLQSVDLTENGRLFMSKDGKVRFIGRHELLKPPYTTSRGTFGDGTGELPYAPGLRYGYDDDQVKTTVRISSQGQSTQVAEDATARGAYGPLTLERSGTLYDTAGEMRDAADYLLTQYKEPLMRADVVEIVPMADPANLLPQVLGRELADRITLNTRPQNVGSAISRGQLIEGIELDITPGNMRCKWYVSPADTREYWVLGTSALGVGTRLGF